MTALMSKDTLSNGDDTIPMHHIDQVSVGLQRPFIVERGTTLPGRRRYLVVFMHRYLNFRLAETQMLAEMVYGSPIATEDNLPIIGWEYPQENLIASPFWYAHLPESCAERILMAVANRAMLVKCFVELWGEGPSWDATHASVAAYDASRKSIYAEPGQSFKFIVEALGQPVPMERKIEIIGGFEECTAFKGPVDLKNPTNTFWAIEYVHNNNSGFPMLPEWRYFGREIAQGTKRADLKKYSLKTRRYLGPTSMDVELSFIMCNMTGVKTGSFVLDPFVGTGSVLIAAADCGAITMGTDIDIRVIRPNDKRDKHGNKVDVWTNFRDYGLPAPVGLLRCDVHRSLAFRDSPSLEGIFNAIVADPPYGVRAGARKSHSKPDLQIPDRSTHIPSTAPYTLAECLRDLLDCAAKWLTVGGAICYWLPTAPGYYFEHELPEHPMLERVANCEQALAGMMSRRLIVMRKVRAYDSERVLKYYELVGPPKMAQDERDFGEPEQKEGRQVVVKARSKYI